MKTLLHLKIVDLKKNERPYQLFLLLSEISIPDSLIFFLHSFIKCLLYASTGC